jgi:hypothetical protein
MVKRWMDYSDDEEEGEDFDEVLTREVGAASLTPYRDAVRRSPATASMPVLRSIVVQPPRGEGGTTTTAAVRSRTNG